MADESRRAPTVFLSYASENREVARRIGASLPAYGLEVWYDESELGGGDAWDQKIRGQIRECDYFMALVSQQTEARREGYFRREWRLAAERTLDMADDHLFLLPVVIDDTDAAHARVPEKFQAVQWLRVPGGEPTPGFEALCRRLASGAPSVAAPRASLHPGGLGSGSGAAPPPTPASPAARAATDFDSFHATPFPTQEPGQAVRFGFDVLGWLLRNTYGLFRRLPRWVRVCISIYLLITAMSFIGHLAGSSSRREREADAHSIPLNQQKLDAVTHQYQNNPNMSLAQVGALVAKEFGEAAKGSGATVLALPFAAPAGDTAARQLADSTFAQTYTRLAVSRHAQLSTSDATLPTCELKALLAQGAAKDVTFVLCGGIVAAPGAPGVLQISLVEVEGKKVTWSRSYPVLGANAADIANEIAAQVPTSDDRDD